MDKHLRMRQSLFLTLPDVIDTLVVSETHTNVRFAFNEKNDPARE